MGRKHGEARSRLLVPPETPPREIRKIKDALLAKRGIDGEICEAAIYEATPLRTFKFRKPAQKVEATEEEAPKTEAVPVSHVAEPPKTEAGGKRGRAKANPDWD